MCYGRIYKNRGTGQPHPEDPCGYLSAHPKELPSTAREKRKNREGKATPDFVRPEPDISERTPGRGLRDRRIGVRFAPKHESQGLLIKSPLERLTGFEPASPAWEAGALPLGYNRILLFEDCQTACCSVTPQPGQNPRVKAVFVNRFPLHFH